MVVFPCRALYLAYLQGGGSDPNIISQLYELQVEATTLETTGAKPEYKDRKKSKLKYSA